MRDPYNYNLDPGIIVGFQSLGAAMNTRLVMEGKGGLTQRTGASYDGWWNGGIRNTATFHNTIAMLTEMIGGPTPQRVPLVAQRQIPQADLALPIAPQEWRFRQSIDYSIELNRAVLNFDAQTHRLRIAVSADGARYVDAHWQWWSKGMHDARLAPLQAGEQIASASGVACHAR